MRFAESTLQGTARIDAQGCYLAADESYHEAFGYRFGELVGSDWKSVVRPEGVGAAVRAYKDMQVSGIGEFEAFATSKVGVGSSIRILLVKDYRPETTFSGHFCFALRPIDPIHREFGMREGEQVFDAALEDSPLGGVLVDACIGFKRINRALLGMLGYSEPELLGMGFADVTHPESFERGVALAYLLIKGVLPGCQFRVRVLRKNGQVLSTILSLRIVRDTSRNPVYAIGLFQELSAAERAEEFGRKRNLDTAIPTDHEIAPVARASSVAGGTRAERLLRDSEERYHAVAEQAWEGILLVDTTSKKILEVTRSFLQLLGYDRTEILRFTLYDLIARERETIDNDVDRILAGQLYSVGERPFRRKDGQVIDLEVSASTVYYGGMLVLRVVVRDVSERRRLEEQLRHAVKMEALGRFAGGIAHDFNNLLVGVLGYSTLLQDKLRGNEPLCRMSGEITNVALRARELTSQLLSMSRRQVLTAELLDLNVVVRAAEMLLRRIIGEDVELICELDREAGRIRANPGQIEQVIMNLSANSRDAMPTGGRLVIRTAKVHVDYAQASRTPGLVVGEYVLLSVRDTGCGMDSSTLPQIFEPFFTTKGPGVGTGLGLSTVYGIVKQLGGYVTVDSQLGKGATFDIYLPRVEEQGLLFQRAEAKPLPLPTSPTVLVVEDEKTVRSLVEEILKDKGYQVLTAETPERAVLLAREHVGPVHLFITDIVMPSMLGTHLAAELLKLRPDARVLYMSGYSDSEIVKRTQLGESAFFLQKPFTPEEILRKVRSVLHIEPDDRVLEHG